MFTYCNDGVQCVQCRRVASDTLVNAACAVPWCCSQHTDECSVSSQDLGILHHKGNGACSVSSQDLPGMSEEEQALLTQLATKKKAAEQVYWALQRAEEAATAAATASGTFYPHAPTCTSAT